VYLWGLERTWVPTFLVSGRTGVGRGVFWGSRVGTRVFWGFGWQMAVLGVYSRQRGVLGL